MAELTGNAKEQILTPAEIYARVHAIPIFSTLQESDFACLTGARLVHYGEGQTLGRSGEQELAYWIQLEGESVVYQVDGSGQSQPIITFGAGESFGEVPLLGLSRQNVHVTTAAPSTLIRIDEQDFWQLMASCPKVRGGILGKMAQRQQGLQSIEMQREKMAALGALSAGLMHELNNPGSAAKRAAAQLRETLVRLQEATLRLTRNAVSQSQLGCLVELQEQVINARRCTIGSLEQADAEEELAAYLEQQGISEPWKIAPTLVGIGFSRAELECASNEFSGTTLTETVTWLEALVSSIQLVATIEESISRVSELVMAVKKYAYEGKKDRKIDVNDSISSTLVILGHKLRGKGISLVKDFAPDLPPVIVPGTGLNQVWTNILDNAIDAAPPQGKVTVRTWVDGGAVSISIADNGSGIPPEHQQHIFDPFYTTKPIGVGTGIGLAIAQEIVSKMGGVIRFESQPGHTVFTVRLQPASE